MERVVVEGGQDTGKLLKLATSGLYGIFVTLDHSVARSCNAKPADLNLTKGRTKIKSNKLSFIKRKKKEKFADILSFRTLHAEMFTACKLIKIHSYIQGHQYKACWVGRVNLISFTLKWTELFCCIYLLVLERK